jgi:hypothetical protein
VTVEGQRITVAGRVRLPVNTAKERRRTVIWMTLTSGVGATRQTQTFTAKPNAEERFITTHTTTLTGALGLGALVKIGGKAFGKKTAGTLEVVTSSNSGGTATGTSGSGTSGSGSSRSGSSGSGSSGSGPGPTPQPSDLDGTFELTPTTSDAGSAPPRGSWFEMLDADEADRVPLSNGNSPLENKDYTPLSPGTDGGLQTFAYQPPPSPAFAEKTGGKEDGNALAEDIMQPQNFFGGNFSVVTEETDPQSKEADPRPVIVDDNGQLSGQITAWAVGWNGEWFNQGSPKPDGTLPGGTIAPSGTYDASTGHYTLDWKSLIVNGPFNGFLGSWQLEGTFVPAS